MAGWHVDNKSGFGKLLESQTQALTNMDLGELLHLKTRENGKEFWKKWIFKPEWFEHQKMKEAFGKMDESTEYFCKLVFYDCVKVKPEMISM